MDKRIYASISEEDMAAFEAEMERVKAKFPWLVSLTPVQRRGGRKLGDKNLLFMEKVQDYLDVNPEFLPSYFKVDDLVISFALWKDLSRLIRSHNLLSASLSDTALQVGVEAMDVALAYYNGVKEAARHGAPAAQTILNELKPMFASMGVRKPKRKELAE